MNNDNKLLSSTPEPKSFIDATFGILSGKISLQKFKARVAPLGLISIDFERAIFRFMAPYGLEYASVQIFQDAISKCANLPVLACIESSNNQANVFEMRIQINTSDSSNLRATHEILGVKERPFIIVGSSKLNPNLTFDTFVTGKANQLARAASIQVARNPGTSYNPMFLYGDVGLGKTHLIHAIGNHLLKEKPNARIRYIHAEQYVSDVVRAYQQKAFDRFKRYYHSLDLLLIDDIQFFSGKSRTQEEFFYAFEALLSNKSQIIITGDTYPKEMAGIDDRLISRFDSGLTVAIESPELEMRVAILMKKAISNGIPMSEDVAFFIAKHLRSNIRELEGALRKILAYVRFHGCEVTIEVACMVLFREPLQNPRNI